MKRTALALILVTLLAFTTAAADGDRLHPDLRPIEVDHDGYVSSDACRSCHPSQHDSWHDSYHRSMTQLATPEAVVAPFDGIGLQLDGSTYQLQRRGDEFWVVIDRPPGSDGVRPRVERPIVLTTGSHHFQTYWIPTGRARELRLLELCYYITEQRWIPMNALPLAPLGNQQTTFQGEGRWNKTCNRCHATGALPRILEAGGIDTQVAEFGIACEACHGPGREHVERNRDPSRRYQLHLSDATDSSIVNPRKLPQEASNQVCGQCHSIFDFHDRAERSRWANRGFAYRPGDDLHASRKVLSYDTAPPIYRITKFWSDGDVRVNGREYNSLRDSPCYRGGEITCLSCHEMHAVRAGPTPRDDWLDDQLIAGMRGDAACLQCHAEFAEPERLVGHTHHAPESAGSRCMDCHMPHTAWGLHKATRSHAVSSPDVSATLATGRPNACNLCHLDKSLGWTATHLERLYEIPKPVLTDVRQRVAGGVVWALSGDAAQRAIVAWHMGWAPAQQASRSDWMAPYLAQLLLDPYPVVRSASLRSLRSLGGFADLAVDFTGSAESRQRARRRIDEAWRGRREANSSVGPAILIDARGIRAAVFRQLLEQRNDRTVYLAE
ncbi:MAG: C cytochrome precursor [Myxococcales bacterium]|nr:C cytochrome precursor [Myxococcales bacterium]